MTKIFLTPEGFNILHSAILDEFEKYALKRHNEGTVQQIFLRVQQLYGFGSFAKDLANIPQFLRDKTGYQDKVVGKKLNGKKLYDLKQASKNNDIEKLVLRSSPYTHIFTDALGYKSFQHFVDGFPGVTDDIRMGLALHQKISEKSTPLERNKRTLFLKEMRHLLGKDFVALIAIPGYTPEQARIHCGQQGQISIRGQYYNFFGQIDTHIGDMVYASMENKQVGAKVYTIFHAPAGSRQGYYMGIILNSHSDNSITAQRIAIVDPERFPHYKDSDKLLSTFEIPEFNIFINRHIVQQLLGISQNIVTFDPYEARRGTTTQRDELANTYRHAIIGAIRENLYEQALDYFAEYVKYGIDRTDSWKEFYKLFIKKKGEIHKRASNILAQARLSSSHGFYGDPEVKGGADPGF